MHFGKLCRPVVCDLAKSRLRVHTSKMWSDIVRGAEGNRTLDLYNANVALSQLSYSPSLTNVVWGGGKNKSLLAGIADWAKCHAHAPPGRVRRAPASQPRHAPLRHAALRGAPCAAARRAVRLLRKRAGCRTLYAGSLSMHPEPLSYLHKKLYLSTVTT